MKPSTQQLAIYDYIQSQRGNLVIEARAGTGKTTTALEAAHYMKGVVFLGAFNKSIATELQERIKSSGLNPQNVRAATLHSVGFKAWRSQHRSARVDAQKTERLLDNMMEAGHMTKGEKKAIGRQLDRFLATAKFNLAYDATDLRLLFDSGDWELNLPEDINPDNFLFWAEELLESSRNLAPQTIDFDDMLYMPLIEQCPFPQHDWVVIDEAQDLNEARRQIAYKLLSPSGRFCAIGDSKQAIYLFAGANSDSLDRIRREMSAETLPLTTTYRCPQSVVSEAQAFCPDYTAAPDNPLGEVHTLDFSTFSQMDFRPTDAILCRKNRPNISFAFQLLRREIPCFVEGRDIGRNLISLAKRWKNIRDLDTLNERLSDFEQREISKALSRNQRSKADDIRDRCSSLRIFIEKVQEEGRNDLESLTTRIESLFSDSNGEKKPRAVTLSSIHKAKGREWPRVFILGRDEHMPAQFAKTQEEQEQEQNLIYVAITRAQSELFYVNTLSESPSEEDLADSFEQELPQ